MQIFIYRGKHGREYWLANTPARLEAAMRKLFKRLDESGCYVEDETHSLTLAKARDGDARCIRHILESRRDCEYEEWDLEEADDPCTD